MALELQDTSITGVRGNIWRNAKGGPSLSATDGVQTLYESWQRTLRRFPNLPAIGYRPIDKEGEAGPYRWSTFKETDQRAQNFAAGLIALNLCPPMEDFKKGLLGLYAKNRMEWTVAEQACNRQSIVALPLYDSLDAEGVRYVAEQTRVGAMLATSVVAKNIISSAVLSGASSSVRHVVLMDAYSTADAQFQDILDDAAERTGVDGVPAIKIWTWSEVEETGAANPCRPTPPTGTDAAFFCYTSGTTGNPKGAIITHSNMISCLAGLDVMVANSEVDIIRDDGSAVHLSYLPLPHVFERVNQMVVFAYGGRIGFYQGDPLKILDDLVALRPTFFPSVPRLLSRIYDKIIAGVEEAGGIKATLFRTALATKTANLRKDKEGAGTLTHRLWDTIVFGPLKKRLGLDRVEVLLTGSAPLGAPVMDFLRAVFGVPVLEGYGQTESTAAGTLTEPHDFTTGHVGVPSSSCEIALFDVPEMGYLSTDTVHANDDTQCRGRGEICFRGISVFREYYKMPEKTANTVDKDGWLHSGDIGVWTTEGKLRIVDRKNNIFKLAQGEYVAAEKIENVYAGSPLILQNFVHGDSLQDKLVAIIVPDPEAIALWASKPNSGVAGGGQGMDIAQLCADPAVKAGLLKNMNHFAKQAGLKGYEFARAIHVEASPFDASGLLTPTFKLKRANAREHYRSILDALYAELNAPKAKL